MSSIFSSSAVVLLALLQLAVAGVIEYPPVATCTPTPQASVPKKFHCNAPATLSSPQYINTPTANTLAACAGLCLVNDQCVSFGYDSNTGSCPLFGASLNAQGWTKSPTSAFVYANRKCWACPTKPFNGNWETGDTYPWQAPDYSRHPPDFNSSFTIASPGYQNSNYAGNLTITSSTDYWDPSIELEQTLNVVPHTAYFYSWFYNVTRTTPSTESAFLYTSVIDQSTTYAQSFTGLRFPGAGTQDSFGTPFGTWGQMVQAFNTGSLSQIVIRHELFGYLSYASTLLDNMLLVRAPALPAGVYVYNGDFEANTLQPWELRSWVGTPGTDVGSITLSSPGQGGTGQAAFIQATTHDTAPSDSFLIQQVPISAGTISFSYAYNRPAGLIGQSTMQVTVMGIPSYTLYYEDDYSFSNSDPDSAGNAAGTWNTISGSFASTDENLRITFQTEITSTISTLNMLIDNVALSVS